MEKNKSNFARVIDWLREHGMIENQKNLAERIGVTENTITRNKKMQVRRPDEETLYRFNKVFGDVVNIAYLRGESDVMLVADLHKQDKIDINGKLCNCNNDRNYQETTPEEISSMMNAIIIAKDEIIAILRSQLADKDALIESKERYINILQQQILDLHNSKQ